MSIKNKIDEFLEYVSENGRSTFGHRTALRREGRKTDEALSAAADALGDMTAERDALAAEVKRLQEHGRIISECHSRAMEEARSSAQRYRASESEAIRQRDSARDEATLRADESYGLAMQLGEITKALAEVKHFPKGNPETDTMVTRIKAADDRIKTLEFLIDCDDLRTLAVNVERRGPSENFIKAASDFRAAIKAETEKD